MALTVIATIEAKSEYEKEVELALRAMLAPTRAEAGCYQYTLSQEIEAPYRFVMTERWRNAQALDEHMATPHMAQLLRALDGLTLGVTITRMRQID
jgi:quinol monooxygenase YgiN